MFEGIETRAQARRLSFQVTVVATTVSAAFSWIAATFLLEPQHVLPIALVSFGVPAAFLPWLTFHAAETMRKLKETRHELATLEKTDQLTRLPNRIGFSENARALFASARNDASPLTAILLDVDHLQAINLEHGHAAGDAVLSHVGELITMNIQPGVDLAARYGGAEFALILPQADHAWATSFAERLRGVLANRPIRHGGKLIPLSASFGIATLCADDTDTEALVSRAAQALRSARSPGRSKVEIHEISAGVAMAA